MKLNIERKKDTQALIEISATKEELTKIKAKVLKKLAPKVKVAGFREGAVPAEMVERNVDQQMLQSEFIDEAINTLYIAALKEERLRPVGQPKVEIKKFVPYTTLDISVDMPVVGELKLPNYNSFKAKRVEVKVGKKEVDNVLDNLRQRSAERKEVKRAVKSGDEALIDFTGTDAKGKPVQGADGNDYPLAIGSNTFIPGFEDNVTGMKPGDKKEFTVTFPKDYGVKTLQNAKVTFTVNVKKISEIKLPEIDDKFAATVGPFKSVKELETDIKKQLAHENQHKVERDYEAAIVNELADKSEVAIPESLIEEQIDAIIQEVRQNVVQRGMTFEEFLSQQSLSEDDYKKKEVEPEAVRRIRAGLVLSEIADIEGIDVKPEELEARIQQLKGQYQDKKMQEQLDQPENRREINGRIRTEKVIQFLKK